MPPGRRELSEAERLDWLRLCRSENIGPITFFQLLERFGNAAAALAALPDLARRGGAKRALRIAGKAEAEAEREAVARFGARLVAWGEAAYPARLSNIDDAPPILTLHGHADLAPKPGVAIVGARNASAIGQRFTRDLAHEIAHQNLVVISGLARGIDRAAHEGALLAGAQAGGSYAFIGAGIDVIFPPENADLHKRMALEAAIYAEMPFGAPVKAPNFPRRNRLIAGASLGVLVVEAALKSGSLITARFAAAQGREVMAVPGSPLDPRCNGSNDLIRQGAALVERLDDVLDVIRPLLQTELQAPAPPSAFGGSMAMPDDAAMAQAHQRIDELLSPSPVDIDELIRLTGYAPAIVQMVLLERELAGRLQRHRGNKVSLI
ncbi:DNA-processing protein DprA [Ferrovibrio sp.]|uniref:DNA-processing protein DprA n=1 Tax=Ferrovibrio sp. TaxID=1917215 RepID=UPI001B79C2A4|nr:DNA-processing protein DprA [Ferrovibrio sp.]MBP7064263.1 DNA-processing protein DprA [Ferrovibrio sp.]